DDAPVLYLRPSRLNDAGAITSTRRNHHESPGLAQGCQEPPPGLPGRQATRQNLCDLQIESKVQGPPGLRPYQASATASRARRIPLRMLSPAANAPAATAHAWAIPRSPLRRTAIPAAPRHPKGEYGECRCG